MAFSLNDILRNKKKKVFVLETVTAYTKAYFGWDPELNQIFSNSFRFVICSALTRMPQVYECYSS